MQKILMGLSLTALGSLVFCNYTRAEEPLKVFVSIEPQAYFAERVGGAHIEVGVLVGTGQNHHTYEPTPRQLADLAGARVYFLIGLPLEKRIIQKIREANSNLVLIDACKGIELRAMSDAGADEHGHGHDEGAPDPHVWLSPGNGKIIASNICDGLKRIDPAHAEDYERNLVALNKELDALNERIAQLLAPVKGGTFYVYHPAFGYFADAYGLRQAPVEIDGKEPTAKQLGELITKAKEQGARAVFVQKQFPQKSADIIAKEIGGEVMSLDPLSHEYIKSLEDMARKIHDALRSN